jgi:hypothetical protein
MGACSVHDDLVVGYRLMDGRRRTGRGRYGECQADDSGAYRGAELDMAKPSIQGHGGFLRFSGDLVMSKITSGTYQSLPTSISCREVREICLFDHGRVVRILPQCGHW